MYSYCNHTIDYSVQCAMYVQLSLENCKTTLPWWSDIYNIVQYTVTCVVCMVRYTYVCACTVQHIHHHHHRHTACTFVHSASCNRPLRHTHVHLQCVLADGIQTCTTSASRTTTCACTYVHMQVCRLLLLLLSMIN